MFSLRGQSANQSGCQSASHLQAAQGNQLETRQNTSAGETREKQDKRDVHAQIKCANLFESRNLPGVTSVKIRHV